MVTDDSARFAIIMFQGAEIFCGEREWLAILRARSQSTAESPPPRSGHFLTSVLLMLETGGGYFHSPQRLHSERTWLKGTSTITDDRFGQMASLVGCDGESFDLASHFFKNGFEVEQVFQSRLAVQSSDWSLVRV